MSDLGLAKGLPHTVRGRDDVTVHQRHFESAGVAVNQHRLVQIRQASRDCAAVSAAADDQHAYGAARLTSFPGGFLDLCRHLVGSRKPFPVDYLTDARETLRQFVERR